MPESGASVPSTVELEDSFRYYRGCYENDDRVQSIEAEGHGGESHYKPGQIGGSVFGFWILYSKS